MAGVMSTGRTRALVGTIDHPVLGKYEAVRNPIRIDGRRRPLGTPPPALGEHTEKILRELLDQ